MAKKEYPAEIEALMELKGINSELRSMSSVYGITNITADGNTKQIIYMENTNPDTPIDRVAIIQPGHGVIPFNQHLINQPELSSWGKYIKKTKLDYRMTEAGLCFKTSDKGEDDEPIPLLQFIKVSNISGCIRYHSLFQAKMPTEYVMKAIVSDSVSWKKTVTFSPLSKEDTEDLLAGKVITVYTDSAMNQPMVIIDSLLGISKTKTKEVSWTMISETEFSYQVLFKTVSDTLIVYHLMQFAKV